MVESRWLHHILVLANAIITDDKGSAIIAAIIVNCKGISTVVTIIVVIGRHSILCRFFTFYKCDYFGKEPNEFFYSCSKISFVYQY